MNTGSNDISPQGIPSPTASSRGTTGRTSRGSTPLDSSQPARREVATEGDSGSEGIPKLFADDSVPDDHQVPDHPARQERVGGLVDREPDHRKGPSEKDTCSERDREVEGCSPDASLPYGDGHHSPPVGDGDVLLAREHADAEPRPRSRSRPVRPLPSLEEGLFFGSRPPTGRA